MAIIQGVIEFAISYLTYSYSYDVIDEDGKQTGCELLGILIISINIWGNLAVSACIFIIIYIVTVQKWNILVTIMELMSIPLFISFYINI